MKSIKYILLVLVFASQLQAQIPNGSFEQWKDGKPVGWLTTNETEKIITIKKSNDARDGKTAALGEVAELMGYKIPPVLISGEDAESGEGFPINKRYARFRGYYKFKSVGGDIMMAAVGFEKDGEAIGGIYSLLEPTQTYKMFDLKIEYESNQIPKTALIQFSITGSGGMPNKGSYFLIDALEFRDGAKGTEDPVADLPDPPKLIAPANNDTINILNPLFKWTAPILPSGAKINYKLKIAELIDSQNPSTAITDNLPHFEKKIENKVLFSYPAAAAKFKNGKFYVWQIQAVDEKNKPVTSSDGKSEVFSFNYKEIEEEKPDTTQITRYITGNVSSRSGLTVSNAIVTYKPYRFNRITETYEFHDDSVSVLTDANGNFKIEIKFTSENQPTSINAKRFKLVVRPSELDAKKFHPNIEDFILVDNDIKNVVIKLEEFASEITGRIVQSDTKNPLSQVTIRISDNADYSNSFSTTPSGNFRFSNLKADRNYTLEFEHPIYTIPSQSVLLGIAESKSLGDIIAEAVTENIEITGLQRTQPKGNTPLENATIFILNEANYNKYAGWRDTVLFSNDDPPVNFIKRLTTNVTGKVNTTIIVQDPNRPNAPYYFVMRKAGYEDAVTSQNIVKRTPKNSSNPIYISLLTDRRPTLIHGTVSESNNTPLNNATVRLYKKNSLNQCIIINTTATQSDGRYQFADIAEGTYCYIRVFKNGTSLATTANNLQINPGQSVQVDIQVTPPNKIVRGRIRNQFGTSVYDARISVGSTSANTNLGGYYLIQNAPSGSVTLSINKEGYRSKDTSITISTKDTAVVDIEMNYLGRTLIVEVTALQQGVNSPFQGATVQLVNVSSKISGADGKVEFNNLENGSYQVIVNGPSDQDYIQKRLTVNITSGTQTILVPLAQGARISGTVRNISGSVIAGALVQIEGSPSDTTRTNAQGQYTLRRIAALQISGTGSSTTINVPGRGPIIVPNLSSASPIIKAGYPRHISETQPINISPGEHLTNIDFTLTDIGVTHIYGFEVFIDEATQSGNVKIISGELINITDNQNILKLNGVTRIPFSNLRLNANNQTVNINNQIITDFPLAVQTLPIKLHNINGTLKGTGSGNLKLYNSNNIGSLRGEIELNTSSYFGSLTSSQWVNEIVNAPTSHTNGPAITSTGQNYFTGTLRIANRSGTRSIWGFSITPNFNTTSITSSGIIFKGTFQIRGFSSTLNLNKLKVTAFGVVRDSVEVAGSPVSISQIRLNNTSARLTNTGLTADGTLSFTGALSQISIIYSNLRISSSGSVLSANLINPSSAISIRGVSLNSTGVSLQTSDGLGLRFTGRISLPSPFLDNFSITNLIILQNGNISANVSANINLNLSNVVNVGVQRLEFESNYTKLVGGVNFRINGLSVQTGNFKFYQNGNFSVDNIGFNFSAGPASVSASVSWGNNRFSGSGSISVSSYFSVDANVLYRSSTNWSINISSGVTIPVGGAITITRVGGSLARNNNIWKVGINGDLSFANMSQILALSCSLTVEAGGRGGPVIRGSGDLTAFSSMNIGNATLTLDFPNRHFSGSVTLSIPSQLRTFVTARGTIDVDIRPSSFFVGLSLDLELLKIIEARGKYYIAHNHNSHRHNFNVLNHPNNEAINGVHVETSLTKRLNIADIITGEIYIGGYFIYNWRNQSLSGGAKFRVEGSVDLWVAYASGSATIQGSMRYSSSVLTISANGSLYASVRIRGERYGAYVLVDIDYTSSPSSRSSGMSIGGGNSSSNLFVRACLSDLCGSFTL